jgi:hypothetical protein
VEVSLLGYGVSLYPTHVGGAPGVPTEYGWCIRVNWVAPWCYLEGEDMMMLPKKWWCNRCFYFGWGDRPRSLRRTVWDWLRGI